MKTKTTTGGITRWVNAPENTPVTVKTPTAHHMRIHLGQVLRDKRKDAKMTLRDIRSVSLGYVSEVERGGKEVSSEVLHTICSEIGTSVPEVLRLTADRIDAQSIS